MKQHPFFDRGITSDRPAVRSRRVLLGTVAALVPVVILADNPADFSSTTSRPAVNAVGRAVAGSNPGSVGVDAFGDNVGLKASSPKVGVEARSGITGVVALGDQAGVAPVGVTGVGVSALSTYGTAIETEGFSRGMFIKPSGGSSNRGDLAVVDCVLPNHGQGTRADTSATLPTRIVTTTLKDCRARGGEFLLNPDRESALRLWLPVANSGDTTAQTRVGEIYEKGMGGAPDYRCAADWYRKASEQGETRAQVNLAALYEKGMGVPKNPLLAAAWYRRATGLYGSRVSGSRDPLGEATSEVRSLEAQLARLKADLEDLRQDPAPLTFRHPRRGHDRNWQCPRR